MPGTPVVQALGWVTGGDPRGVASPLNAFERSLKRIFLELGNANVPCALIGGLAVSARAEPHHSCRGIATSAEGDDAAKQRVSYLQNGGYVMRMLLE